MTLTEVAAARSIGEALQGARRQLLRAPFEPSSREATLLMSHLLGLDEATILAHPERPLADDDRELFESLMRRRLTGEPTAYLLGEREFYGRGFEVDDRVLIPRPETEHLIEEALTLDLPPQPRILDIGTGSGVIALTLALEIEDARLVATDSSPAALVVAHSNRLRWSLTDRVALIAADLVAGLRVDAFDLVVSNPPYISPRDKAELSIEITHFEPHQALFAPPDGLTVARRILRDLDSAARGCWLLMEIGAGQREAIAVAARQCHFAPVRFIKDYAGIPRIAALRRD